MVSQPRSVQSSHWDGAIFLVIPGTSVSAWIGDRQHSGSRYARAITSLSGLFGGFTGGECTGEGGIRTLGTLLRYSALAKRRFRPLSHLTWICGGKATSTNPRASNETFHLGIGRVVRGS